MSVQNRKHIVMMAYPAFGHVTPLLELARRLGDYHDISFVTSRTFTPLLEKHGLLPGGIKVTPLPDKVDGTDTSVSVARIAVTTDNMAEAQVAYFRTNNGNVFTDQSGRIVHAVIADSPISGALNYWADRGLPIYIFTPFAAMFFVDKINIDENTPGVPDELTLRNLVVVPGVPEKNAIPFLPAALKRHTLDVKQLASKAAGILFNSDETLESEIKQYLESHPVTKNVPLKFVGPLFPSSWDTRSRLDAESKPSYSFIPDEAGYSENDTVSQMVKTWLDGQTNGSVVYVSFGSMLSLQSHQLKELAKGLLDLNRPVIWSLKEALQNQLPTDIQTRFRDRNDLVLTWVPQKLVLSHRSTRVFVTHTGWNSLIESLFCGVPMVAWPMFGDQFQNAEFVQHQGTGKKILAGTAIETELIVTSETVRMVIEDVAGWADASKEPTCVITAMKWREILEVSVSPGGRSAAALLELAFAI